jgi:chromosome partitioning protein
MIIIAIVTTKGGAAKSTTSTCIAVAACEASLRVLLIDVDPQRTTAAWAARRRQPDPTVVAVKLRDLGVTLQRARDDGYDVAIIDTPAQDVDALAAAATAAHFSILVCRPTWPDIEVAAVIRDALQSAGRPYGILLTQTPPVLNRRLQGWLATSSALGAVVDGFLVYRLAYQDAQGAGLGVTEWEPNGPAAREVRGVFSWILANVSGDRK